MLFGIGKNKSRSSKNALKTKERGSTSRKPRAIAVGRTRSRGAAGASGSVNKLFHGVAVRSRDNACCEAVQALGSQRFLSEDAPLLPLTECGNPQGCRCVYEHFDERRDNLRRETDVGLPQRTYPEEKRKGHGRRITDG